jgi:hypothetical protein
MDSLKNHLLAPPTSTYCYVCPGSLFWGSAFIIQEGERHLGFSLRQRCQARTHAVGRASQIMTRRNRKRHRPTLVCRCFDQAYICGGHAAAQPTSHVSMTAHPSVMLKSVCRPYVVVSATLVCQIACYARESSIWIVVSV